MYIISKQKDYYDGVVGTVGIDKTIVYERVLQEIENEKDYPQEIVELERGEEVGYWRMGLQRYHVKKEQKRFAGNCAFIVGFCGKLYVGWKFYRKIERRFHYSPAWKVEFTYDADYAAKYMETQVGKNTFLHDQLKKIDNANVLDVFREYNTPAFAYDCEWSEDNYGGNYRHKFEINPILKDLQFYKVFDAFTAFQEIQMFISGVLGTGEKEMVEIEDKYKIGQHGFDKWSFRREPTKKKG